MLIASCVHKLYSQQAKEPPLRPPLRELSVGGVQDSPTSRMTLRVVLVRIGALVLFKL